MNTYSRLTDYLKPRGPEFFRGKEEYKFSHFPQFIDEAKDYVMNGGLQTQLVGTKKEIKDAIGKSPYFDWVIPDFFLSFAQDIQIPTFIAGQYFHTTPLVYPSSVLLQLGIIDLTLRTVRGPKGGKHRLGPGIIGIIREGAEYGWDKFRNYYKSSKA